MGKVKWKIVNGKWKWKIEMNYENNVEMNYENKLSGK